MCKNDEILNKILLNMKYDSKMTLNENYNIIISEQQKKPKITIDKPEFVSAQEYSTKKELTPNGGELILPTNAKILSRFTTIDKPKSVELYCKNLLRLDPEFKDKTLDFCIKQVIDKYRIYVSKNSVSSFEVDGKTYKACYALTDKDLKLLPLKDQKFFSEYSTSCNPPGESWKNDISIESEKTTQDSYDNEEIIHLDLEL